MSYERGIQALRLQMPDRIPHTEYCSHPKLVEAVVGADPRTDPSAWLRFYERTNYDLLWHTNDGPAWQGRTTSMGHAIFQEDGSDYDPNVYCPFTTPEEVLAFDPPAEFGVPDPAERAAYFEQVYQLGQAKHPMLVFPGGYYKTLFSACIDVFGWEMFLAAAPLDYRRFGRVLDGFYEITLANIRAWARTSIEVFICHDDIVWSSGPVFHPDWYRTYVFPKYRRLWAILKEAGKIVLFCSDGDFSVFIDDIAEAGADGFILEPMTDLTSIVARYGQSKVIIGNVDTRILTFGDKEQIRREVERCVELGRRCPGYFIAVGNHIPHNVPIDNALYYLELVERLGRR